MVAVCIARNFVGNRHPETSANCRVQQQRIVWNETGLEPAEKKRVHALNFVYCRYKLVIKLIIILGALNCKHGWRQSDRSALVQYHSAFSPEICNCSQPARYAEPSVHRWRFRYSTSALKMGEICFSNIHSVCYVTKSILYDTMPMSASLYFVPLSLIMEGKTSFRPSRGSFRIKSSTNQFSARHEVDQCLTVWILGAASLFRPPTSTSA